MTNDDGKKPAKSEVATASNVSNRDDPYNMSNSDASQLTIVTVIMNGTNYLTWRRSMKIALNSKVKIGFVDGTIPCPEESDPLFNTWKRIDSTVLSWLLNSLTKDLYDSFMNAESAQELWDDLHTTYGQCNGHLIYNLKREIVLMRQGTMALSGYFNKLKTLWDELNTLTEVPKCLLGNDCRVFKFLNKAKELDMLIQFLMGLNDTYDSVRSNLLVMDPLPTAIKAYSLVTTVETGRDGQIATDSTNNALLSKRPSYGRGTLSKRKEKSDRHCDNCDGDGHTIETCFKLTGTPEWYTAMKERKLAAGRGARNQPRANIAFNTPLDHNLESGITSSNNVHSANISALIKQEMAKYFKELTSQGSEHVNFATEASSKFDEFAGPDH